MTFTVGIPGGTRDFEFEAYVRLLEKSGVNVAKTARVLDPVNRNRWLHAWSDEGEAETFAATLREETENNDWNVYSLPDAEATSGPLGPIEILASRQSDGCTYSLSPTSRKLILRSYPRTNVAPNVFVAGTTQADFERTHGRIWAQVAIILTGLSDDQMKQLGGYRIIDSATKQILFEAPPLVS